MLSIKFTHQQTTFVAICRTLHKLPKRQLRFYGHILNQEQPGGVTLTVAVYYIVRHRPFDIFTLNFRPYVLCVVYL